MDFKDCIVFKRQDNKGRIAVPRASIKAIKTEIGRNYSTNSDDEVTVLTIDAATAHTLGCNVRFLDNKDTLYELKIGDEFKVALGMLRGDKSTEVLFTNE